MNLNPYHFEVWPIPPETAQGRVQFLRAGATLSEALERMRAHVRAAGWKSYRCGVYLLKNGLPDWQELHQVKEGRHIRIV